MSATWYGQEIRPGRSDLHEQAVGHSNDQQWAIALAEIVRVDYEKMKCDLRFLQGEQPPALGVRLSAPYWSKRGFLGAMPEEGSIAVVGFLPIQGGRHGRPLILSYLPNGSTTALRFDPLGLSGERDADEMDLPEEEAQVSLEGIYGPERHKMRKIYPGEVFGMSDEGAELMLDKGAQIMDRKGGKFQLRAQDKAGLLVTMDQYTATAASRRRSGRIVRNALNVPSDLTDEDDKIPKDHPLFADLLEAGLIFDDGQLTPDVNSLPATRLSSGERHSVLTNNGKDPDDPKTSVFTEERAEIQEFSNQRMPHPPELGFDSDLIGPEDDHFKPFIEKVTGTVVGNDPYTAEGRRRYGQILRPSLFSDAQDNEGQPRLEVLDNTSSEQEKNLAAAGLYRMRRPDGDGELFVSHDKEGHCYLSIPASSSKTSNLGGGRSVEADLKGSAKMTMGSNQNDNESLNIDADGGFKWNIGTLDSTHRSLDVRTEGGVHINAEGSDRDAFAMKGRFTGDWEMAVDGNIGMSSSGDYLEEVGGYRKMSSQSCTMSVGTGNLQQDVASDKRANVKGQHKFKIGTGEEKTIVKPLKRSANALKTEVKLGNESKRFLAPADKKTKFVAAGRYNISANGALRASWTSNALGSFTFRAPTGNYSITLGSGAISMTTGGGAITLTSGATINMTAPTIGLAGKVGLGGGQGAPFPVIGGKPGPSPHISRITGLPLDGNPMVTTV